MRANQKTENRLSCGREREREGESVRRASKTAEEMEEGKRGRTRDRATLLTDSYM